MARSYARLLCSIWRDADFVSLPAESQRMFLLVISQPELNALGVMPYRPKMWADFAPNTTYKATVAALSHLGEMLVVDERTDELWVRSFMRLETLTQPILFRSAARLFGAVHSDRIRAEIVKGLPVPLQEGFPEGYLKGSLKGLGEALREGLAEGYPKPLLDLSLNPEPRTLNPDVYSSSGRFKNQPHNPADSVDNVAGLAMVRQAMVRP